MGIFKGEFTKMSESKTSNYAHTSIHYDMLNDSARTQSYRDAIFNNKSYFEGKIVCDVGCGTGILSLFAAKAGARKVYAIECTDIANTCQKIIDDNGYSDVISLMRGKSEDIVLPEKVDIIISEWMGYSLYYEMMLPAVLSIRDRFLKEDGRILPSKATLYLNICEDPEYRTVNLDYWDSTYDFNFKAMKDLAFSEPVISKLHPSMIVGKEQVISSINIHNCTKDDIFIMKDFLFVADKHIVVDAFVTYFDVRFDDMESKVVLSTSPFNKPTHWQSTIFYLKENVELQKGDKIEGVVEFLPNPREETGLIVKFTYCINDKIVKNQTFDFI